MWVKRHKTYANGNLTEVEFNTPMNNGTSRWQKFSNYTRGKAQTITLPNRDDATKNITATLGVDANGWTTAVTNFNGNKTSYSYDTMGRVTKVDPTDTAWLDTTYTFGLVSTEDLGGKVVTGMYKRSQTQGNLTTTTYYDTLFQPLLINTSDGTTHRYQRTEFNAYGKPTFKAYPSASATESQGIRYTFDGLQRQTKTSQTATNASETTAYLSDNKVAVTNYKGHKTTTTYLAYGEPKTEAMTQIDSPESVVTSQTYNPFGNVTAISQGGISQNHFYNSQQQLCKIVRPETGTTAVKKNAIGETTWVAKGTSGTVDTCDEATVPAADKTLYSYDNLGARKTVNYPDTSPDLTYTYDNQGNLKTLNAVNTVQTYTYNSADLLTTENLAVDGKNFKLTYGYTSTGALDSLTFPGDEKLTFAPNAFGEPTTAGTYATAAKYHPAGQLKSFNYGNGFVHNMTLNSRQLPSAMSDIRSGVKAIDQTYSYDNQGNISALTDKQNSAFSLSSMTYDGLDRLTAITSRWGTNIAHVGSISYDKTGNITAYNVGKTNLTYTHTNNRVDKIKNSANTEVYHFSYDSRGNVTNNKLRTFSFNRANQLGCSALTHQSTCATGTNRYIYDGFNRRVKTTDATGISYSMYSQDGTLLFKHKDGFDTNYIYLGKKLIARSEDAFAPQTAGSSRQHNLPFGETVETPKNDVGYTGHKFDTDLGLSYMQQRYYDPAVGVFYSPDPVGYTDENPVMSFNRYLYVNNNPYKYTDPDGEFAFLALFVPEIAALGNATLFVGSAAVAGYAGSEAINAYNESSQSSDGTPDVPDDLVGDQGDSRAGPNKSGNRHTSGPLTTENGGTGNYAEDLEILTGGTTLAGTGDSAPPGSAIEANGIFGRENNSSGGASIDIPANGDKPHETLHYDK